MRLRGLAAGSSGFPNAPPTVVWRGSCATAAKSTTTRPTGATRRPASCSMSKISDPPTTMGNETRAMPVRMTPTPRYASERFIPWGGGDLPPPAFDYSVPSS